VINHATDRADIDLLVAKILTALQKAESDL
jgi:hypothetical protein